LVIRCERCSTLYELDEALLAPGGSSVQCTRCDHVFTARLPRPIDSGGVRPSALELENAAAAIDAAASTAASCRPRPGPSRRLPRGTGRRLRRGRSRSVLAPRARAALRARRRAFRLPPDAGTGRGARPPVLRQDTVGAFESRLRFTARLRWLAPAVALGVVVLGAGGWFLLRGRVAPGAASARAEDRPSSRSTTRAASSARSRASTTRSGARRGSARPLPIARSRW
jgi:predicted Zn finger-like uncharacterized protein